MTDASGATMVAVPPIRRRWLARVGFALLTAAAVALFVIAGNWQRDRMHAKEALRDRFDAAAAMPAAPLPDATDWLSLRYRSVVATGAFDARAQIFIDNRVHAGQAGYEVVAPFALDDGRRVLVDRGWVAQGPTRAQLPDVPPPPGTIALRGRIEIPAGRYFELSGTPSRGPLWQHLDPPRFATATGIDVLPIVIEQTAPAAPGDVLVREHQAPDFGIEQHRIYMMQWYSFAIVAIVLWAVLTVRETRRSRRRGDD